MGNGKEVENKVVFGYPDCYAMQSNWIEADLRYLRAGLALNILLHCYGIRWTR